MLLLSFCVLSSLWKKSGVFFFLNEVLYYMLDWINEMGISLLYQKNKPFQVFAYVLAITMSVIQLPCICSGRYAAVYILFLSWISLLFITAIAQCSQQDHYSFILCLRIMHALNTIRAF